MGWHDRITLEQFQRIKDEIERQLEQKPKNANQLDSMVATVCGVGYTTARQIRLSEDYESYCARVKGKYWRATELPEETPNLPHIEIEKRDVDGGVKGVGAAEPIRVGNVNIRIIVEEAE